MARMQHTPTLASLEEAITVLGGTHEMGNFVRQGPKFALGKRFLNRSEGSEAHPSDDRLDRPSDSYENLPAC